MKVMLISALAVVAVGFVALQVTSVNPQGVPADDATASNEPTSEAAPAAGAGARVADRATAMPPFLRVTDELVEDGWVDGSRTTGADQKPLADASNSVCFLTKVEISGISGPDDANSCRIDIDEFTGFWQLTAEVDEGGVSQVRCNARCLVWGEETQ